MKASRKKNKTTPKESGSQVPKADIGTHVVGLLEGPWGSSFHCRGDIPPRDLDLRRQALLERRQRRIHHAGAQLGPRRGAVAHQLARPQASDQIPVWLSPFAGSFGVGFSRRVGADEGLGAGALCAGDGGALPSGQGAGGRLARSGSGGAERRARQELFDARADRRSPTARYYCTTHTKSCPKCPI